MDSARSSAPMRRLRLLTGQLVSPAASAGDEALPYRVEPVTPSFGAEVFGFNFAAFLKGDETLLRQINATFLKHKVLMFRDAGLESEQQLQFLGRLAKHWGISEPSPLSPDGGKQMASVRGPHGLLRNPFAPQIKGREEIWPVDEGLWKDWSRAAQGVIEVVSPNQQGTATYRTDRAANSTEAAKDSDRSATEAFNRSSS